MEYVSECPSQLQEMRSLLVIVSPAAMAVVQLSGRFCMRVLMCLCVLLSEWVRCVYVVRLCGVFVGSFGSGCDWWLVSVPSVVSRVCWTLLVGFGVSLFWFGSSCGGVFSGWVDGVLMGLSMVTGLMGLWMCRSLFMWVVVLVGIRDTWCVWVSWVCLLLLGFGRDLSVSVCDCDV